MAYGRERLLFAWDHRALLSDAGRDPQTRFNAPACCTARHVRMLLAGRGHHGDLDAQADALMALLDADYVAHQVETAAAASRRTAMRGRRWPGSCAAPDAAGSCTSTSTSSSRRSNCGATPNSSGCR